ncbi:MAG: threonylcarbamoyl-AMP synthase [Actinobacteria bacterium]|nr:threonylcarbamoyl-AMP synthase [Actinomycetota bacterium]
MTAPGPPVVAATDPGAVDRAAAVLVAGGTVVLPTDTVYGLAALPARPGATGALFRLKARAADQPLAVLVADADQAVALLAHVSAEVRGWMERWWPGALTIVGARSTAALDLELGAGPDTIGIRCPDLPFLREVAARVGPIATTSANRSGEPTPQTAAEAAASLDGPVGLVVDGGPAGTLASTVVDTVASPWRVLRVGAVSESDLRSGS